MRECLSATRDPALDLSSPELMKELSPDNCHICLSDEDMISLNRREFIERHRKQHQEMFYNEDCKLVNSNQ